VVVAPGQAWKPRTFRSMAAAGLLQSITPSSLRMIGAWVARSWSCGVGVTVPSVRPFSVSTRSSAPSSASRPSSCSAVSSAPIGVARASSVGPVSSPASMSIVVTPVSVSPFTMAHCTGAAPR
jgi:hypothetical protein